MPVRIREVADITEFKAVLGMHADGILLEPDLDFIENETEEGGRKRRDAEVLTTLSANMHGPILDLGTSHGRSAFKLATNQSAGGHVYTVNLLPEQHDGRGQAITHLITETDIGSYYRDNGVTNVTQIFADTTRWTPEAEITGLGIAFVDACHDEAFVYADSKLCWSRLREGGYLAWHDFSKAQRGTSFYWIDDVMRGVERFMAEVGLVDAEVVHLKGSWIGVLRKPVTARVVSVVGVQARRPEIVATVDPMLARMKTKRWLLVYPEYNDARRTEEEQRARDAAALGWQVDTFGIPCRGGWWQFPKLDAAWRGRDRQLMSAYERLAEAAGRADILFAAGGSMVHPQFLEQLGTYNIMTCSDDPESSDELSRPVASAFDFCFPVNVATVADYRRWGCARVEWLFNPIGPNGGMPLLQREQLDPAVRDLPVSILCERDSGFSDRPQRLERLMRAFPAAFVRGAGWPGGFVPQHDVLRRTRIGWNLHHSTGPTNTRSTALPAYGVMQLCDNKTHLGAMYRLGVEAVGFDTIDEAIELTRYYMAHDDERQTVAWAGWERAMRDYTETQWWERIARAIAPSLEGHSTGQVVTGVSSMHVTASTASAGVQDNISVTAAGVKAPSRPAVLSGDDKPRILLLADRRGWAYDLVAHALQRELAQDFTIDIAYVAERPVLDASRYDLLHVFFWGETYHRTAWTDAARVSKEVSSHRWALEAAWGPVDAATLCGTFLSDAGTVLATSARLAEAVGAHRAVQRVMNGFDPDMFFDRGDRSGPIRFGWAGNAQDACKGLEDIIAPAAGSDFEVHIAGGSLSAEAMAEFYAGIDVLLVASTAEGTPLPLLEGMACGCFPVAVDVGVVPEVVQHRDTGLVIPRSVADFRAAMQWCVANPGIVRSSGRLNAVEIAETRSWSVVAPSWRAAFTHALSLTADVRAGERGAPVHRPVAPLPPPVPSRVNGNATITALKANYSTHFAEMNTGTTDNGTYRASSFYYEYELQPLLPADRNARVVDLGSGYGHLVRWLLERGYANTGGVELEAALHAASQAQLGAAPQFLVNEDAISFLAQHPREFDLIISYDVIEHFPLEGALAFARAIRGALRPGGRVVLRTPNMANLFGVFSRYIDLTHQIGFTEFSLAHLLREAGFSTPVPHVPLFPAQHELGARLNQSRALHDQLFSLQDRSTPRCFDKNLVMWGTADA